MEHWVNLAGKVCVVTGAGGGIGEGIARAFSAAGASVALLDQKADQARAIAHEIGAEGKQAIGVAVDVSNPASVADAASKVRDKLGAVDILVNNAGFIRFARLEDVHADDWSAMMDVNLRGYLLCAQAFGSGMLARGQGIMVHIASIAATEAHPFCSAYGPGKAAIVALNEQMTLEWAPRGIRTNCISPGLIRTPLSEAFYSRSDVGEVRREAVPLRRIGTPRDIADAALFLASDHASYICGANLIVDGGLAQTSMLRVPRPVDV